MLKYAIIHALGFGKIGAYECNVHLCIIKRYVQTDKLYYDLIYVLGLDEPYGLSHFIYP